jgi:CheY-like chemotaxis protein
MHPNRTDNFCCTGGGGAMSMAEYAPIRIKSGKTKADQIKETGANALASACHNCEDGLSDLVRHYKLGMPVKNVCVFVADACITPEKDKLVTDGPIDIWEPAKGASVLIVDDDIDSQNRVRMLLDDNGFKTAAVSSYGDGLRRAKSDKPDMISLAVNMPSKEGLEMFRKLRSDADTKNIPVYIVAKDLEYHLFFYQRGIELPEGYREKPIDNNVYLLTVNRILTASKKKIG